MSNRTWYIPTQIYHGFRISTCLHLVCVFHHQDDTGRQNDSVWNWEIIVIIILVQIPYQPLHHNTETELSRAEKTQNITHMNTQWQFFDLAKDKSTDSEPMVYLCGYIPGSIRHIWCYILPRVTCVIPLVLDPHTHTQPGRHKFSMSYKTGNVACWDLSNHSWGRKRERE